MQYDTVYHYYMGYAEQHLSTVILQNENELASLLQKTGYTDNAMKKPAVAPDFGERTVFAFAGWPCTIVTIVDDSTTITIQYREEYRNIDQHAGDSKHARPANVVTVYAIPRTDKTIAFMDITKYK